MDTYVSRLSDLRLQRKSGERGGPQRRSRASSAPTPSDPHGVHRLRAGFDAFWGSRHDEASIVGRFSVPDVGSEARVDKREEERRNYRSVVATERWRSTKLTKAGAGAGAGVGAGAGAISTTKDASTGARISGRARKGNKKGMARRPRSQTSRMKAKSHRISLFNTSPPPVYLRNTAGHLAVDQIALDLARGPYPPFPDDVREAMGPKRLKNRKIVFQRVLMEVFRVSGRVRVRAGKGGEEREETKFLTNMSCNEMGELILELIERGKCGNNLEGDVHGDGDEDCVIVEPDK